jgi:NAD+ diphosphatase
MISGIDDLTFAGVGFDRADHLRDDQRLLEANWADAKTILLWRGKPLIDLTTNDAVFLRCDHPILSVATAPIFLGLMDGNHIYAHDISSWVPEDLDAEKMMAFLDDSQNHHPGFPTTQLFCELRSIMALLPPLDAELITTAKAMFAWHRSHQFCAACGVQSEMAKSGWQRNCPSCNTPHFPRTDPVVIMLVTHGNSLLLGRAPIWPDQMYSCLAGFVEPGETIEAAVAREVFEETTVKVKKVRYIASQPWAFPSSLMFGCICEAETTDIRIDPQELEDAKWVTKETLVKSIGGKDVGIKPARPGAIASYLMQNWLRDRL